MRKEVEIKQLLREQKLTQMELAELLGVTSSKLSHHLNGYSKADKNLLNKALRILKNEDIDVVSIAEIVQELSKEGIYTSRSRVYSVKNKLGIQGRIGSRGQLYFTPQEKDKIMAEIISPGSEEGLITYEKLAEYINKNGGTTKRGFKVEKRNISDYIYEHRIFTINGKLDKETADNIADVYINFGKEHNEGLEKRKIINKVEPLKSQLEEEREYRKNAEDDRDRYKKMYEDLKKKTEKKHRFLFWKW